jgi:hypothetical protein
MLTYHRIITKEEAVKDLYDEFEAVAIELDIPLITRRQCRRCPRYTGCQMRS